MNAKPPSVAQSYFNHCLKTVEVRKVDNAALGYMMRKLRQTQGVSLRYVARQMDLSAPYVSDMELGRRNWTVERVESFLKSLPQMPEVLSLRIRSAPSESVSAMKLGKKEGA
jgi:hypothetical protein